MLALHAQSESGFNRYFAAIERYDVLDRERELELAQAYAAGDTGAGDRLVCCSLRYVVKIAYRFRGYGFRTSELVAEGNVGLLQALRRFEPERGLRFMTYASYWVRAQMLKFILEHWSLVGLGTGPTQSKLFFRLQREKARMLARVGPDADVTARLAERFECSEDRIRRMEQRIEGRDVSLDGKAHRDGPLALVETLPDHSADPEAHAYRTELTGQVRDRVSVAMSRLDAREQAIVQRRLLSVRKETLADLGKQLGISRERVRQIEVRVKGKLKRTLADLGPVARAA